VLLPALFTVFFTEIFGGLATGPAGYQREAVQYMVSMMAYGAIGAALGATIRISFDRTSGWLRQLQVTPVPKVKVLAVDVAVGVLLTLPSLVVLALLGGLLAPVEVFPESLRTLAHAMPSYWYAQLGRDVAAGSAPSAEAVLALAGFTAAFAVLAVVVARRRPLYAVAG
jgi:ABC-2 type transport system permease protein